MSDFENIYLSWFGDGRLESLAEKSWQIRKSGFVGENLSHFDLMSFICFHFASQLGFVLIAAAKFTFWFNIYLVIYDKGISLWLNSGN